MHPSALEGFGRMLAAAQPQPANPGGLWVLDIGGADVNGTVHALLPRTCNLDVVDIAPGPGVTIVGDASTRTFWTELTRPMRGTYDLSSAEPPTVPPYDLVISTETLEHVRYWQEMIVGAHRALCAGGWFVGTCASTGRRPHGARGASDPGPDEWYANITPSDLVHEMLSFFDDVVVEYSCHLELPTTHDLYWRAQRL